MSEKRFSKREAIEFGWNKMKDFIGLFIFLLIFVWLVSLFFSFFANLFRAELRMFSLMFEFAGYVFSVMMNLGFILISLRICDGKDVKFSDFFSYPLSKFYRFVAAYILYLLITLAGLVLLVLPGFYWGIKYQYALYLVADENCGVVEAFNRSSEITNGVKWQLLKFDVLIALIVIVGFMAFIVGIFAAGPTAAIAAAYVFRKLSSDSVKDYRRGNDGVDPFQAPSGT